MKPLKSRISPTPVAFRRALLAWYEQSGRHALPWRREWSPYHILVSEFMLQQTTVAAVLPYYGRFLKEFPTVRRLADAPAERVLELWSGLGYYARARNLHAAAQALVREHGGRLPQDADSVKALPGVGRYTAGALLSFAYDKPEALVDGNVIRVLSRIYGVRENVKERATVENIWSLAWKLVPPSGARRFNSALMDLGATVCRPSGPDCLVCPFFSACWARRNGAQSSLPAAQADRPRKEVHVAVALVGSEARWLLVRRPEQGLYGGLWEFPGAEVPERPDARRASSVLGERLGFRLRAARELPEVRHGLSHREMRLHPWLCEGRAAASDGEQRRWASAEEIESMAVSSLTRRVLRGLVETLKAQPAAAR